MRFPILDLRSRNLSRVAMIVFAAAAAGGCSSDTGRFGGGEPYYTGSTPNQRAILQGQGQGQGQAQPAYAQTNGWRNVETTGSIAPAAPPVARQDLAPPPPQPSYTAPAQSYSAPAPQPPRVAAASGWTTTGGSWITAQHGDTVDALSRRYGVPASAIAQANGLAGNAPLQPGQRVMMPVYSTAQAAAPVQAPAPVAAAPAPAPAPVAPQAVRQIPTTKPVAAGPGAPPAPLRAPTPAPAPVAKAPQPGPDQGSVKLVGDYTVRKGDTLASIARTYGVSEQQLKERNGLKTTAVQPGQHLLLPAGTKLLLKTSQAPAAAPTTTATAKAADVPAAAPVKQVAQAPIATPSAKPATQTAATAKPAATPSSTAKIDQKAAETIAVAKEPAVEEPSGSATPGSFRWPVRGRVISEFGNKANGEKNEGINLAVPEGTSIKAADDGEVIYSGNELKGYGNLVLVRHQNGYVTAYAHASELLVNRGEKISRGQIIARAGATGSVTQPQLHFELRKGQKPVDPKPYLASN